MINDILKQVYSNLDLSNVHLKKPPAAPNSNMKEYMNLRAKRKLENRILLSNCLKEVVKPDERTLFEIKNRNLSYSDKYSGSQSGIGSLDFLNG